MLTDLVHEQLKIKYGAENLLINWVKIAKELNRSNGVSIYILMSRMYHDKSYMCHKYYYMISHVYHDLSCLS